MKIAIISQSPYWTTGFGVTCYRIALGLEKAGHAVICFSVGDTVSAIDRSASLFKIWPANKDRIVDSLLLFIRQEDPDAILINYDIKAASHFINICKLQGWKKKLFAHVVIDGFPVYENILQQIREIDGVIVPTKASRKYLRSEGVPKVYYAPHGVDHSVFVPLKNKVELKAASGIRKIKNKFVIGVFAANEERKQIPKILLALHYLILVLKQRDVLLYLHTQATPNDHKGWDLECLVKRLKLTQYVIFTAKDFQQDKGAITWYNTANEIHGKKHLSYIERLNMCDVIVNVPFSGGFELCNIEAQACGIPVITIDDNGNIKEVVGDSAYLIQPAMKTIWGNGAWIFLVDEMTLAHTILQIKSNPGLQESLRQSGLANAGRYHWSQLEQISNKMITGF